MSNSTLLKRIREMILSGELSPGARITELGMAETLGVSRTPVRNVLPVLASEGYLEAVGKRGFAVKKFDLQESLDVLELRATLEGVAARYLVNRGVRVEVLSELEQCLQNGDALFSKRYLTAEDEEVYGEMNARFHQIIVDHCGSQPLIDMIEGLNKKPFIGPSVVVFDQVGLDQAFATLFRAHGQHHDLVEAMEAGDAARAEAIFREHGNAQRHSLYSRISDKGIVLDDAVTPLKKSGV
ncbi:MAG: GntR family transcriptional regulator [Pseudomonadales bacterium]